MVRTRVDMKRTWSFLRFSDEAVFFLSPSPSLNFPTSKRKIRTTVWKWWIGRGWEPEKKKCKKSCTLLCTIGSIWWVQCACAQFMWFRFSILDLSNHLHINTHTHAITLEIHYEWAHACVCVLGWEKVRSEAHGIQRIVAILAIGKQRSTKPTAKCENVIFFIFVCSNVEYDKLVDVDECDSSIRSLFTIRLSHANHIGLWFCHTQWVWVYVFLFCECQIRWAFDWK